MPLAVKRRHATLYDLMQEPLQEDGRSRRVASCLVSDWYGDVFLYRMWVEPSCRRQGFATQLLRRVIADFGRDGLTLEPSALADKPMDDEQLATWYAAHGFQWDEDDGRVMIYHAEHDTRVG